MRIGSVGRWRVASELVEALADTVGNRPGALDALDRLAVGLTTPLRLLDELASFAERAAAGDHHAACELRDRIGSVVSVLPEVRGLTEQLGERFAAGCDCLGQVPRLDDDEPALDNLIDEEAGVSVALVVDQVLADQTDDVRHDALDAVLALAAAAARGAGLAAAYRQGGHDALLERLEHLAATGQLAWMAQVPPTMTTMSATMPASEGGPAGVPGVPGLPGVPGGRIPGRPGGGRPPRRPDNPEDLLPGFVKDLLARLRKPRRWDPEIFDHPYRRFFPEFEYIDWQEIERIKCMIAAIRLLRERQLQPPLWLPHVVWSDGITSIEQGGACAGDKVVIRGAGFGATKPADVDVTVPRLSGGCRPVGVPPANWSDTEIQVTLPPDAASGPIGFVDTAYVEAYDAWARRQNELAEQIRRLFCARNWPFAFVAPFKRCPKATPFNAVRAGSATIKSFTANSQAPAVVEPGDPITLRWTVDNAEHIRIDRTSASGPTFAGSTSLIDPPGTSYALAPAGHTNVARFAYRLTATGPCGTVTRDLVVVGSKRPRLTIDSVEVTQSIQTTASAVRLVQSKPTVVRVTVRHGLGGWGTNTVPGVTGRIRVHRGAVTSGWIDPANGSNPMAATPGASITVPANPQRNNTDHTLNFLVPPAWCTGSSWFEIETRVSGFGAGFGFGGFNSTAWWDTGSFTFEGRRTLELRYIRVNWGGSTPTHQTCRDTLRTAVPLLPTPTANISALAGVGVQNPGGTANSDRDDLLTDFDDRHNCSWWEAATEWLGSDCPDDDGAIWVLIPGVFFRGRAFDIPSNVCFTPPSDGPYAAHELAHCLNQAHVSVMCANGQQATGGDAPSAWPNNAQLLDVPFDVTRNAALTLAGTGVFDVMTYCGTPNNTWPMPARWQALWDRIGS